jgi:aryl-alcohol dehydrogenase-like predicted oxidoreductase
MPFPGDLPKQENSGLARYRQLSPSAAVFVSPLCLGTMNFGDAYAAMMGECSKEMSFAILDRYFYTLGGNFIDTANSYHGGQTEEWLGEWMAARANRDQLVLATKFTGPHRNTDQDIAVRVNYGGNGAKSLRLTLEDSLKRLRTTYLDILYVHWWSYTTGIPELMHALNDLVAAGKVLYLGISDTPAWVVSKANQYARDHGLRQFVVYQGAWNAAARDFERDILPMCRDEGMGIAPYSVLNSGRFQTQAAFKEREGKNIGRKMIPGSEHDKKVSKVLERVAASKDSSSSSSNDDDHGDTTTSVTDVALAYITSKAPYIFPIVGGRKVEHLDANVASLAVSLTREEVAEIDGAYGWDAGFPHTFLSGTIAQGFDAPQRGAYKASEVMWTGLQGTVDWVDVPDAITPR